ncbi:MAG: E3 binding domain-containing protein [Anaerolineae bacterium]
MTTEVLVPPLGQTVDTVVLVTWYKNEGETVAQGDPLFAVETDKATLDVEAPASGVLRQVTAQPGDVLKVLNAIALIAAPDEAIAGEERGGRIFISPRARRLVEERNIPLAALQATGPEGAIVERDVRSYLDTQTVPAITPVARRMAEEAGLDWHGLSGGGPGGRITRDDVVQALKMTQVVSEAVPPPTADNEAIETIPVRSVRAVIAERMARSVATTAHVTLTAEADATALVELPAQCLLGRG